MPEWYDQAPPSPTRKRTRPDTFLTPAQIIAKCRKQNHCLMVAGHAIALIALMQNRQWSIAETALHAHIGRSTLSEILSLKSTASTDTLNTLAETFGLKLHAFDLLADFCLSAEASPCRH